MEKYERTTNSEQDYYEYNGSPVDVYNKLVELENQIENGTLKFIPCKVGDKVYYETFINNGSQSVGVQPHEVKSIYTSIVTSNFSGYGHTIVELDEVGKTVFLTEAEAKKKLEILQGGAK